MNALETTIRELKVAKGRILFFISIENNIRMFNVLIKAHDKICDIIDDLKREGI